MRPTDPFSHHPPPSVPKTAVGHTPQPLPKAPNTPSAALLPGSDACLVQLLRAQLGAWRRIFYSQSSHPPPLLPLARLPRGCPGMLWRGGGGGTLQGALPVPLSPQRQVPASTAFATDSNRPQPLWQPPPTACLTASRATSEVPSLLMHPWGCPQPTRSSPSRHGPGHRLWYTKLPVFMEPPPSPRHHEALHRPVPVTYTRGTAQAPRRGGGGSPYPALSVVYLGT